jgi:hypothetical protein
LGEDGRASVVGLPQHIADLRLVLRDMLRKRDGVVALIGIVLDKLRVKGQDLGIPIGVNRHGSKKSKIYAHVLIERSLFGSEGDGITVPKVGKCRNGRDGAVKVLVHRFAIHGVLEANLDGADDGARPVAGGVFGGQQLCIFRRLLNIDDLGLCKFGAAFRNQPLPDVLIRGKLSQDCLAKVSRSALPK